MGNKSSTEWSHLNAEDVRQFSLALQSDLAELGAIPFHVANFLAALEKDDSKEGALIEITDNLIMISERLRRPDLHYMGKCPPTVMDLFESITGWGVPSCTAFGKQLSDGSWHGLAITLRKFAFAHLNACHVGRPYLERGIDHGKFKVVMKWVMENRVSIAENFVFNYDFLISRMRNELDRALYILRETNQAHQERRGVASDTELPPSTSDGPISPSSFQWRGERTEKLTKTEYKLLAYIFERRANPPTVDELIHEFWSDSLTPSDGRQSYDTFASKLRKKLNPLGATIETDNGHAVFRPLLPANSE